MKITHFFTQIKIKNKHLIKWIIYPQIMISYNPDIFAPNTQEYRRQGIQRTRTNHRNFSPQPIDAQHQQPIQQQNLINTQSFQPIHNKIQ